MVGARPRLEQRSVARERGVSAIFRPAFPHSAVFGAEQLTFDASQSAAETVDRVQDAVRIHPLRSDDADRRTP